MTRDRNYCFSSLKNISEDFVLRRTLHDIGQCACWCYQITEEMFLFREFHFCWSLSYDKRQELVFQFIEEFILELHPAKKSVWYRTIAYLCYQITEVMFWSWEFHFSWSLSCEKRHELVFQFIKEFLLGLHPAKKSVQYRTMCMFVLPDNWSHGLVLRIPLPLKLKLWQETWVSVSGHWRIYIRTLSCKEVYTTSHNVPVCVTR